jgi:hypothetical protein
MALADIGAPAEISRHVAPLGWEHVSLTGDYFDDCPDPDALRPLRVVKSRSPLDPMTA